MIKVQEITDQLIKTKGSVSEAGRFLCALESQLEYIGVLKPYIFHSSVGSASVDELKCAISRLEDNGI